MDDLVGRGVRVPRCVFAVYINQAASQEPPNGEYWEGAVTEHVPARPKAPFTVVLKVLDYEEGEDSEEEQLVEVDEEHHVGIQKLRDWLVLRGSEKRETLGANAPKTLSRSKPSERGKKRRAEEVFETPEKGTRSLSRSHTFTAAPDHLSHLQADFVIANPAENARGTR